MFKKLVRGFLGFVSLSCIYLFSLFLFHYFAIPLPPALIGIFMLLILLIMLKRVPACIGQTAGQMLSYMGLFLLPALISVLLYGDVFAQHYVSLIAAVGLSTVASLGITLWLSQRVLSRVKANIQVLNAVNVSRRENDE
jgi:holin-like protein